MKASSSETHMVQLGSSQGGPGCPHWAHSGTNGIKGWMVSGNSVQVQGFSEGTEGLSLSPDLGMVFFSCSWASNRGWYSHPHTSKPLAWGQHCINPTTSAAHYKLSLSPFRQTKLLAFLVSLWPKRKATATAQSEQFGTENRGRACGGQTYITVTGEDT